MQICMNVQDPAQRYDLHGREAAKFFLLLQTALRLRFPRARLRRWDGGMAQSEALSDRGTRLVRASGQVAAIEDQVFCALVG